MNTKRNKKNEKGASLVEYALLVALIAIAAIAGINTLGEKVSNTFDDINEKLDVNLAETDGGVDTQ